MITWDTINKGNSVSLSDENLTAVIPNSNNTARASEGKVVGKWYWEVEIIALRSVMIGIVDEYASLTSSNYNTPSARYYYYDGRKYPNANNYGQSYNAGDTISILLDLDNENLEFWKNGISQGVAFSDLSSLSLVFPAITSGASNNGGTIRANFGDSNFKYTMPNGYKAYDFIINNKFIVNSNNKKYSLKPTITKNETNMTSNTTPAPLVASASSANTLYTAYKAFNGIFNPTSDDSWNSAVGVTNAWVQIDYSTPRKVNTVILKNRWLSNANSSITPYTSPKDFDILGSNDGVNFRLLKSERGLVKWDNGEVKTFKLNTVANFRYYRVHILNGNNDSGNTTYDMVSLAEIEFLYVEALTELPVVNLNNFINYGANSNDGEYFDLIHDSKDYVLQDGINENAGELRIVRVNRKPLSIKFN